MATYASAHRLSVVCIARDHIETTIDELIAEEKQEALLALLGRRLEVLTDSNFLPRLEARRSSTSSETEREELALLADLVVDFVEEVAERLQQLEPAVATAQEQADNVTSKAAAAAVTRHVGETPRRRAPAATAPLEMLREDDAEAEARERRAAHRFLVERLLDAAHAGVDRLEALLHDERKRLDRGFFEHLQWEVEEQRKAGNRRMLEILEVVVQRACVEVEGGQLEVALLSALLQTRNSASRHEMYQRELAPAGVGMQAAFKQLLLDTQLEIEKAVLRGESVDPTLLQQLRVIGVEVSELTCIQSSYSDFDI
eukprot:CAMPEP_0174701126 /NCGR_PEP_ID=MMETSP1094-20130205/5864_1 /TAXON_ID=156173 /ORGANISM="Chrysochromulina brevifilum, Strain UTEX LB 985" /LENGTH=313 /DNA_ID=CAMNT_0015898725 /DNA_START=148 /DNA_END=1089 /DNA_ORIENTATION=+